MDCALIDSDLVGFHFATLSTEERARVEQHLPGCARCVRAYLTVKQSIEAGAERERPSEMLRARIRASMAVELRRRPSRRWWVGGAAAAMAAAAVLVLMLGRGQVGETPKPSGGTVAADKNAIENDSSAVIAQSMNVL